MRRLSAIWKRQENLEGSCAVVQDGECSLTRVVDGSARIYLKENGKTSVDLDGKNVMDLSENRGRAFGRAQFLADRLQLMMLIAYIDPEQQHWERAYYGDNYPRLQRAKAALPSSWIRKARRA